MNQTTIQSSIQSTFQDLDGKVAIITGGSSLIAAATADALVRNGVAVALAARNVENLQRVSSALVERGEGHFHSRGRDRSRISGVHAQRGGNAIGPNGHIDHIGRRPRQTYLD